jgi:hypothetical protein
MNRLEVSSDEEYFAALYYGDCEIPDCERRDFKVGKEGDNYLCIFSNRVENCSKCPYRSGGVQNA